MGVLGCNFAVSFGNDALRYDDDALRYDEQHEETITHIHNMNYDFEIIGEIGYGLGSEEYVAWMLQGMEGREVNVRVCSLGGSAIAGLNIATRFKEHGNVTVHLMGMNASAATILAMGARKVCMDSNGGMLIHKCMLWMEQWGNMNADELRQTIEEMAKTAEQADAIDAIMLQWYMNRCKKPAEDVLELMQKDKFITAEEALEFGLVDEIEQMQEGVPAMASVMAKWVAQADRSLLYAPAVNGGKSGAEPAANAAGTVADTTTNTTNKNMNKTYTAIAALAGIEAPYQAVADKDGNVGCYVAEAQLDVLEVAAAKAKADAEALAKANIDLATANAAMEQMKTEHETALAALREEMNAQLEAKVAELNTAAEEAKAALETEHAAAMEAVKAEHTAALEAANTEHATALASKDAELATAKADLTASNEKVTALEAQVAEMAAAAPEPQVPAAAPAAGAAPKVKAYAEMTTAEKAQYEKEHRRKR